MSFTPGRVRARVNVAKKETWIDQQTGESPSVPRGFALDIEIGLFTNTDDPTNLTVMDFTGFTAVTVEVHDNAHRTRAAVITAQATDFNVDLSSADWLNEAGYHCKASFSENDMALDLGADSGEKTFWVFIYGLDASGKRRSFGGTTMKVYETGYSGVGVSGPNQGANLIPPGAVYDGSGNYVLAVTIDKKYEWTKGANDTQVVNGGDTYGASQIFTAQGSSITLKGTAGAAITSLIRYPLYPTLDELYAVIRGLVSATRAPGQYDNYISKSKIWKRTVGISDDGVRVDEIEQL